MSMINLLACGYIGLPIVIFILGWVRWYIAVPVALAILFAFFLALRNQSSSLPVVRKKDRPIIILSVLIIMGWVLFSGIGGFAFQTDDHMWRNEIFRLLVEKDWPVMSGTGSDARFLCYYIGFWMPAALFGKVFGLGAGFIFQSVWAILGVILVWLKLTESLKRWSLAALLIFILFSGLDILGFALKGQNIFTLKWQHHIEWWTTMQYSSHTTQLYWVFNQAIYGWLITLMILNEKKNSNLILIWSCGLLTCTFPFVGMIPFLTYKVFRKPFGASFKELFSMQNILGGGLIGIISGIYLLGNTSTGNTGVGVDSLSPSAAAATSGTGGFIADYLLFLMVEVLLYFILIFRFHRKNPLYYITLGMLMLCPLIRIGGGNDFCMRASIPALLVLCLLVTECLFDAWKKHRIRFIALLAVFLIGAITPIHELARGVFQTIDYYRIGRPFMLYTKSDLLQTSNFSSSTEGNWFFTYLAK